MVTALQPLIDATPALGHLDLVAGTVYAGPAKVTKKITVNGNGARSTALGNVWDFAPGSDGTVARDLIADGPTQANASCFLVRAPVTLERVTAQDSLQYGIRQYNAAGVTVNGATIRRIAAAYEVHGYGNGTILNDLAISQVDRMMVDTAAAWGGDGVSFYKTDPAGVIRINRLTVTGARAKTAMASWPYDGSALEGYGQTGKVIVDGFTFRDCVNMVEVGTDPATPNLVPTGWELRNGTVNGNPVPAPGWDQNCEGLFLRANRDFLVENVTFRDLDDFILSLVASGGFVGVMAGNLFRSNTIYLKPGHSGVGYGPNRAYLIDAAVNAKAFGDVLGNRVIFDPAMTPDVALYNGKPPTNAVQVFAGQTGWSFTGETWGLDCSALQAQVDALTAQNAVLTAQRDAAQASADKRGVALGQIIATAQAAL